MVIMQQQNFLFFEHQNESLEVELRELQGSNERIKAENGELAERVKNKLREGKELKKRLQYLQGLEAMLAEGKSTENVRHSRNRRELVEGKENSQQILTKLQSQFNELMLQSKRAQGSAKNTARLQLGQIARKIKSLKQDSISKP